MKSILVTFLLSCALAGWLPAQTTGSPSHVQNRVRYLTARLGLSADQQSQAAAIFSGSAASEAALRGSLRTARQGLEDAVKSNNTVGIEQLSQTIGQLTSQLTAAQAKARAAFYQTLTPEQRAKADQLESQRAGRFGDAAHLGSRYSFQ